MKIFRYHKPKMQPEFRRGSHAMITRSQIFTNRSNTNCSHSQTKEIGIQSYNYHQIYNVNSPSRKKKSFSAPYMKLNKFQKRNKILNQQHLSLRSNAKDKRNRSVFNRSQMSSNEALSQKSKCVSNIPTEILSGPTNDSAETKEYDFSNLLKALVKQRHEKMKKIKLEEDTNQCQEQEISSKLVNEHMISPSDFTLAHRTEYPHKENDNAANQKTNNSVRPIRDSSLHHTRSIKNYVNSGKGMTNNLTSVGNLSPISAIVPAKFTQEEIRKTTKSEIFCAVPAKFTQEEIRKTTRSEISCTVPAKFTQEKIRKITRSEISCTVPARFTQEEIRKTTGSEISCTVPAKFTQEEIRKAIRGEISPHFIPHNDYSNINNSNLNTEKCRIDQYISPIKAEVESITEDSLSHQLSPNNTEKSRPFIIWNKSCINTFTRRSSARFQRQRKWTLSPHRPVTRAETYFLRKKTSEKLLKRRNNSTSKSHPQTTLHKYTNRRITRSMVRHLEM